MKAIGIKPKCKRCKERPVAAKERGRWRSICWKCVTPIRSNNAGDRRRIRKRLFADCVRCGYEPKRLSDIEIDHIDGNRQNGAKENLQTLCKKCHSIKTIENKEYLPYDKRPAQMSEAKMRTRVVSEGEESCGVPEVQTLF